MKGIDYDVGIKLYQAKRGMPKHNRLMKVLNESGVKKLVQKVEADYMREKRVHELDEALLFAMDEKGHDAHLTDLGREKIAPNQPDLFVVPDLSQLIHEIDTDGRCRSRRRARSDWSWNGTTRRRARRSTTSAS